MPRALQEACQPAGHRRDEGSCDMDACPHIFQQAGSPETSAASSEWQKIVPGGECECADGSEFDSFWERRADPTKVVFYLDAGGGCWDAEKCALTVDSNFYTRNIADDPATGAIFDLANPDNPFADYSFVHVPYCTGDAHLGDATRGYSPELTVKHKGYVNGTTASPQPLRALALRRFYPSSTWAVNAHECRSNSSVPSPYQHDYVRAPIGLDGFGDAPTRRLMPWKAAESVATRRDRVTDGDGTGG